MPKVDMSAKAITTRLKRVSQLRRLGLSLKKAKVAIHVSKQAQAESKNSTLSPARKEK